MPISAGSAVLRHCGLLDTVASVHATCNALLSCTSTVLVATEFLYEESSGLLGLGANNGLAFSWGVEEAQMSNERAWE
eukprot:14749-Heterococcus_DN1.PRE.3